MRSLPAQEICDNYRAGSTCLRLQTPAAEVCVRNHRETSHSLRLGVHGYFAPLMDSPDIGSGLCSGGMGTHTDAGSLGG